MAKKISLLIPDMPSAEEVRPFLERIDKTRWYTNFGPLVKEFEAALQMQFESAYPVVTTSSGTAALELALSALCLPKGSAVLAPAFTFVATISSIIRAGLEPVLADVDSESWVLTPEIARRALDNFPIKAVLPVATFGCPLDQHGWDAFCRETSIPVLIDAAGAFGNQSPCSTAAVVFSLHATKALGAGEGGFVIANNTALIQRIRKLTNFGIDPSAGTVSIPGSNGKLSEYHAAVGLAALRSWPERKRLRQRAWHTYAATLRTHWEKVILQSRPENGAYTISTVRLPRDIDPEETATRLASFGIETRRWYYPLINEHEAFRRLRCASDLTVARALAGRILGIPFHLQMTEADFEYVARNLGNIGRSWKCHS